jgi:hypothetical protein
MLLLLHFGVIRFFRRRFHRIFCGQQFRRVPSIRSRLEQAACLGIEAETVL